MFVCDAATACREHEAICSPICFKQRIVGGVIIGPQKQAT